MAGYRDLVAWKKAMNLVADVYRITLNFPREETYGLSSQLRRASVSVPSNIAEGYGRNSRNELHHFIGQARGSLFEVETQIQVASDLNYISPDTTSALLKRTDEISRVLAGLRSWSETA